LTTPNTLNYNNDNHYQYKPGKGKKEIG